MIYFDACALLKFIKQEPQTEALRAWRQALPERTELTELSPTTANWPRRLEISGFP